MQFSRIMVGYGLGVFIYFIAAYVFLFKAIHLNVYYSIIIFLFLTIGMTIYTLQVIKYVNNDRKNGVIIITTIGSTLKINKNSIKKIQVKETILGRMFEFHRTQLMLDDGSEIYVTLSENYIREMGIKEIHSKK